MSDTNVEPSVLIEQQITPPNSTEMPAVTSPYVQIDGNATVTWDNPNLNSRTILERRHTFFGTKTTEKLIHEKVMFPVTTYMSNGESKIPAPIMETSHKVAKTLGGLITKIENGDQVTYTSPPRQGGTTGDVGTSHPEEAAYSILASRLALLPEAQPTQDPQTVRLRSFTRQGKTLQVTTHTETDPKNQDMITRTYSFSWEADPSKN